LGIYPQEFQERFDDFVWEILEKDVEKEKRKERESFWIIEKQSFCDDNPLGLNSECNGKRSKNISENISKKNSGKTSSKEVREKISKKLMGHSVSEETRKKISDANSGDNHVFFGKSRPQETRDKISKSSVGKKMSKEACEKMSKNKIGKKQSTETKIKRLESFYKTIEKRKNEKSNGL